MTFSNKVEKMVSRKRLAWNEENQGRKGDKRNKRTRGNDKREFASDQYAA